MARYYYPNATNALDAKKQFLREHHYRCNHCFRNTGGNGFVCFDTKEDVNAWWKEKTGEYFYKEEYEKGTVFTKNDAIKEIERTYGSKIDKVLRERNSSLPYLAIGLPSSSAFGNNLFLCFVRSQSEEDIEYRFYSHYVTKIWMIREFSNSYIRSKLVELLYNYFYNYRFKKRIEGSQQYSSPRLSTTYSHRTSNSISVDPQPSNSYSNSYSNTSNYNTQNSSSETKKDNSEHDWVVALYILSFIAFFASFFIDIPIIGGIGLALIFILGFAYGNK